jgi:DNA repair protein RadD
MELVLREHQVDILDKLRAGFADGHRAQVLYGPCGFGKTEVAVSMMSAAAQKGKRAAMIVDRRILAEQTSARFWKYGIDHGIIMAGSTRWRPDLPIQICTAQTLEARDGFPMVDLLIVDECHTVRESTSEFIRNHPDVKVIGLSGSPFTKGMGQTYTNVECATTIQNLVDAKWLIDQRVFIAKQIDMTGAKKVAGEWSQKESTSRGIKITGDIVSEWVAKTHEIFGAPRKTIVFCAGVAHGEDLSKKFAEAGYNFISISYRDDDDYKAQVLEDFNRPDTSINGIIATDILTKGFDQSDVMIGVSARPFSKSFSSHVQQLGRVMRIHEGKDQAIWLCHSGNYLRFRDQWDDLYSNGVLELDDGAEKTKPEPTEKEKEAAKCPKCSALWTALADICSNCGHVRERKNDVVAVAGEMLELGASKAEKYSSEFKEQWYQEMLGLLEEKGKNVNRAFFLYQEKFKSKPPWKKLSRPPSEEVARYYQRSNMAYAKRVAK